MADERIPARKDQYRDRNRYYDGRKNEQRHRRGDSFHLKEQLMWTQGAGVRVSYLLNGRGHGNQALIGLDGARCCAGTNLFRSKRFCRPGTV